MTVTLYSITPPTQSTSFYMLRPTLLNGPRPEHVDDWLSSEIEDDGFLERMDRSAESVEFP